MNKQVKVAAETSGESELTTDIGRRIRDSVRELIPLIRKNALEGERAGAVPDETMQALQKTGLFLVSVPLEHGGYALGARDLAEILVEVGRGDGSTAWVAMIASGHTRIALSLPDQAIAEIYARAADWPGPTIAGGSLFSDKIQKAEKADGGLVVKAGGKWLFASGSKHAAYAAVGVDFEDAGEKRRGMVLLERSQYEIVDDWHVMGMRASSSNSLTTTVDVFVPPYRFLDLAEFPTRLASFRSRFGGLGYQLDALGVMLIVPLEMNCAALGMAKAGYECFVEQAKARKPFNLPYPKVADSPSVQVTAGKVGAMIRAAEALLMNAADKIDRKALAGEGFEPAEESQAIMDMVYAGNLCGEALDMMQYALGSSTIIDSNPIQRFVRDVRVILTHGSLRFDPAAEINGRHIMGLPPFAAFAGGLPGVSAKAPEHG